MLFIYLFIYLSIYSRLLSTELDRGAYVNEVEQMIATNREKRNALRIGNECLRYMTMRQEEVTRSIGLQCIVEIRSSRNYLPFSLYSLSCKALT